MIPRRIRFPYPLPHPVAVYDGHGKYPERVKVAFSDGHVRTYVEEVKQPAPVITSKREMRRMYLENGGYKCCGYRRKG